jgi:hypothetical protein
MARAGEPSRLSIHQEAAPMKRFLVGLGIILLATVCGTLASLALTPPIMNALYPPPAAGLSLTLAQSEGRALDGYMKAFGYTTQSSFAAATHISATRISRVHLGTDTLRTSELDSISALLWRRYRAEFDTSLTIRIRDSYLRVFPPTVRPLR